MKLAYQLDESRMHYITVDLDVWSRSRLEPLAAALGKAAGVHYVGPGGKHHAAHFGVRIFPDDDASRAILALTSLVRRLPAEPRRLWERAHRREFNVGIQAALEPSSFELVIAPAALRAVADLGGTVAITVYAPESGGHKQRASPPAAKPTLSPGRRTEMKPTKRRPGRASRLISVFGGRGWSDETQRWDT